MLKRVTVTTVPTIVHDQGGGAFGIFAVFLKNAGAVPLNSFAIQGRNSSIATWVDIATTAEQFLSLPSSLNSFLTASDASISPTLLPANGEWNGAIYNRTFLYFRLVATVASGSTEIDVEVTNGGNI